MHVEALTHYSHCLKKDMHMMIYGQEGVPFLAFPTQNSMCRNYEDFGMIDHIRDFLDNGRIQLFVVDTVDKESWSDRGGDNNLRAARQEQYYHYIVDEVVPLIRSRNDSAARTCSPACWRCPAYTTWITSSTAGSTPCSTKTPPSASCPTCPTATPT